MQQLTARVAEELRVRGHPDADATAAASAAVAAASIAAAACAVAEFARSSAKLGEVCGLRRGGWGWWRPAACAASPPASIWKMTIVSSEQTAST